MKNKSSASRSVLAGLCLTVTFGSLAGGCQPTSRQNTAPKLPATAPTPEYKPSLADMAEESLRAGDTKTATKYAQQWLKENTNRKSWQYGNTVHDGNQILGVAALRENRIADAKKYLIAAGKSPGSPQLDSFGPEMILAQRLLEKNEGETVIRYLDLVSKFWAFTSYKTLKEIEAERPGIAKDVQRANRENQRQIDDWKKQIRAGKKPKLHNSDSYL